MPESPPTAPPLLPDWLRGKGYTDAARLAYVQGQVTWAAGAAGLWKVIKDYAAAGAEALGCEQRIGRRSRGSRRKSRVGTETTRTEAAHGVVGEPSGGLVVGGGRPQRVPTRRRSSVQEALDRLGDGDAYATEGGLGALAGDESDHISCCHRRSRWRVWALRLALHRTFTMVIGAGIIASAASVGLYDPLLPMLEGKNAMCYWIDVATTLLFTAEAVVQIVALGPVGPASYLADPWRWLDLIVVGVGWIATSSNYRRVSSVRMLRALRGLTFVPATRHIVNTVVVALPALTNVMALAATCVVAFALLSMQLWRGVMGGACGAVDPLTGDVVWPTTLVQCSLPCSAFPDDDCTLTYGTDCPTGVVWVAANTTGGLAANYTIPALMHLSCMRTEAPDWGMTSFDTAGTAILLAVWSYTTEGWSTMPLELRHTWGWAPVSFGLWTVHVFLGAFLLLELALAAVWDAYVGQLEAEVLRAKLMAGAMRAVRESVAALSGSKASPYAFPLALPAAAAASSVSTSDPGSGGRRRSNVGGRGSRRPSEAAMVAVVAPPRGPTWAEKHPACARTVASCRARGARCYAANCARSCCPLRVQRAMLRITSAPGFRFAALLLVLVQAILLGGESETTGPSTRVALHVLLDLLVALFVVELVMVLSARGVAPYFSSARNVASAVVVALSAIDALADAADIASGRIAASGAPRLTQAVRALITLRLLDATPGLRTIAQRLYTSIVTGAGALATFGIFLFVFGVIGRQFFAGAYDAAVASGELPELPRLNFDTTWLSIVTVFEITDNENSDDTIKRLGATIGWRGILFTAIVYLVGCIILLNVFLAVLLSNFDDIAKSAAAAPINPAFAAVLRRILPPFMVPPALRVTTPAQTSTSPVATAPDAANSRSNTRGGGSMGMRAFAGAAAVASVGGAASPPIGGAAGTTPVPPLPPAAIGGSSMALGTSGSVRWGAGGGGGGGAGGGGGGGSMVGAGAPARPKVPVPSSPQGSGPPRFQMANVVLRSDGYGRAAAAWASVPLSPSTATPLSPPVATPVAAPPTVTAAAPTATSAAAAAGGIDGGGGSMVMSGPGAVGGLRTPSGRLLSDTGVLRTAASFVGSMALMLRAPSRREGLGPTEPPPPPMLSIRVNKMGGVEVRKLLATTGKAPIGLGGGPRGALSIARMRTSNQMGRRRRGRAAPAGLATAGGSGSGSMWGMSARGLPPSIPSARGGLPPTIPSARGGLPPSIASVRGGLPPSISSVRGGLPPFASAVSKQSVGSAGGADTGRARALNTLESVMTRYAEVDVTTAEGKDNDLSGHMLVTVLDADIDDTTAWLRAGMTGHVEFPPPERGPAFVWHAIGVLGALRKLVARAVNWPWFQHLVVLVIGWSSINLAMDHPHNSVCNTLPATDPANCHALVSYLSVADTVVTAFFLVEAAGEVFSRGLFKGPRAYLRRWRLLDALVVAISVASLAASSTQVRSLRALRAFRALRALRLVARFPALRLVMDALVASLARLQDTAIMLLIVSFIFAVFGMQIFRGSMFFCNDADVPSLGACVGSFNVTGDACGMQPTPAAEMACRLDPLGAPFPRVVMRQPQHFDSIGRALLTVFELVSGENWPTFMTYGTDGRYHDTPVRDHKVIAALYYLLSQLVLNMTLVEVFAGVIVSTYMVLKKTRDGTALLTPTQWAWVASMRTVLSTSPWPTIKPAEASVPILTVARRKAFNLLYSRGWRVFMVATLVVNTVTLLMHSFNAAPGLVAAVEGVNAACTAVYGIESLGRVAVLGPQQWIGQPGNLVLAALAVGSAMSAWVRTGTVGTILGLFRVVRVFRLAELLHPVRRMARTIILSLPAFFNVLVTLSIIIFIYANVGTNMFAGTRYSTWSQVRCYCSMRSDTRNAVNNPPTHPPLHPPPARAQYLSTDVNFDAFGSTYSLLLRWATGENYDGVMHDLAVAPPFCDPAVPNCGTSLDVAALYFVTYYSVTAYILLSMLTAVVLEYFDTSAVEGAGGLYTLTVGDAQAFASAWARNDHTKAMVLPVSAVVRVVSRVPAPLGAARLGVKPLVRHANARTIVLSLPIVPNDTGCLSFHSVLSALADHAAHAKPLGVEVGAVLQRNNGEALPGRLTVREVTAVRRLQRAFRAGVFRRPPAPAPEHDAVGLVTATTTATNTSAHGGSLLSMEPARPTVVSRASVAMAERAVGAWALRNMDGAMRAAAVLAATEVADGTTTGSVLSDEGTFRMESARHADAAAAAGVGLHAKAGGEGGSGGVGSGSGSGGGGVSPTRRAPPAAPPIMVATHMTDDGPTAIVVGDSPVAAPSPPAPAAGNDGDDAMTAVVVVPDALPAGGATTPAAAAANAPASAPPWVAVVAPALPGAVDDDDDVSTVPR